MSLTIAQVTLADTTAQQDAALSPFLVSATALLGGRLEAVTIHVRKRIDMPQYRNPKATDKHGWEHKARGYWRSTTNTILLADDLFAAGEPLAETCGHELVHVLFDSIPRKPRRALLAHLVPRPENYADTVINGTERGYPALPEECIATWGSAALFGFAQPAYATLYKRRISAASYPVGRDLLIKGPVVWSPADPDPLPVPNPELEVALGRIAELEAALDLIGDTVTKVKKTEDE